MYNMQKYMQLVFELAYWPQSIDISNKIEIKTKAKFLSIRRCENFGLLPRAQGIASTILYMTKEQIPSKVPLF